MTTHGSRLSADLRSIFVVDDIRGKPSAFGVRGSGAEHCVMPKENKRPDGSGMSALYCLYSRGGLLLLLEMGWSIQQLRPKSLELVKAIFANGGS